VNRSPCLAAAVVVLAACGGSSDKKTPPPPPTPVDVTTFQAASFVIGQPDLTTVTPPACTATSLDIPYGAAAWDGTRLFISDTNGNRVHAYTGSLAQDNPPLAFSLGSDTCAGPGSPTSGTELSWPQSVRTSGAKLLVADSTNNRVLVWNAIPTSAGVAANVAVGQTDLTTWTAACGASSLNGPQSAFVTPGGKLIVADQGNHRVLVWNAIPTASGTAANLVLGQVSKTTCDPPADVNEKTLSAPSDVWSDGTRLVVVDPGNHRVLVWSTFPTSDGQAADAVLGQATVTAATSGTTDNAMAGPVAVASDGTRLFVADQGNNRVLVFGAIPSTGAGAPATVVLGQADFTHGSANAGGAVTAKSLSSPSGLAVIDGKLFVTDALNHRVVVFVPPAP
jgi:hypothetical protein